MEINEIIKEIRIEKNMNQIDFAQKIGVGKSIISYWENGIKKPGYDNLKTICEVFDLPPDYVLGLSDYGTESTPADLSKYFKPGVKPDNYNLDDRERAFLARLRALPPEYDFFISASFYAAEQKMRKVQKGITNDSLIDYLPHSVDDKLK